MEEYVKQLKAQLETEFNKINLEGNAAKGYGQCAKLVKDCIDALKSYLVKHPFKDLLFQTGGAHLLPPIFLLHEAIQCRIASDHFNEGSLSILFR